MKIFVTMIFLPFLITLACTVANHSFKDFGMNKPHLLFHLGDRSPISVNYGLGYWFNNPASQNKRYFTQNRIWYENDKNDMYVTMLNHNGDSHIHQELIDRKYHLTTNIRYELQEQGWSQLVQFQKTVTEKDRYVNHTGYWFQYITVENNDPALVNHKDYVSPIYLSIESQGTHEMVVKVAKTDGSNQYIYIKSQNSMKVFGFSMNISESYDIRSMSQEVKHLVELSIYKGAKRTNDSKLHEWENKQVKLIRKNEWMKQKFVILFFYGEFKDSNQVFVSNYTKSFNLQQFTKKSESLNNTLFPVSRFPEHSDFLRHVLYNLYGGIAFYYGVLYTQNSLLRHELDFSYTFTPSRLIFPRGFLWDDGFHLSVALHYNPDLTLDILHNWIRKIDLFGWIGREQIRGSEMSSLMPQMKFIYQDIFQMNPPTIILPIITLIDKAKEGELEKETINRLKLLLEENFWKLEKWYRYFVTTQSHHNLMQDEAINRSVKYRWRCKDDCERGNFMGSGLDDYPRTATPRQLSKQHVDLMSWIYFFSEGLQTIAGYLDLPKPEKYYKKRKEQIQSKIMEECLDPQDLLLKDISVAAKNEYIDELVTRIGYINLFPFFTGLLRDQHFTSEEQNKVRTIRKRILEVISDEDLLLSEDGIRSLSISDSMYGTDDNYWRGAVWMPINYMVLRACKKYYWSDDQSKKVYSIVRERLINTVKSEWSRSGYLYENYHLGGGNRGYPFYGWTSLILNIITQQY